MQDKLINMIYTSTTEIHNSIIMFMVVERIIKKEKIVKSNR